MGDYVSADLEAPWSQVEKRHGEPSLTVSGTDLLEVVLEGC